MNKVEIKKKVDDIPDAAILFGIIVIGGIVNVIYSAIAKTVNAPLVFITIVIGSILFTIYTNRLFNKAKEAARQISISDKVTINIGKVVMVCIAMNAVVYSIAFLLIYALIKA